MRAAPKSPRILRSAHHPKQKSDSNMTTIESKIVTQAAPVLIIPDVIPDEMRQKLIDIWHSGSEESFMMVEQTDGSLKRMYDREVKARLDHFIGESDLLDELKIHMTEKVCPAIQMAFRFDVTRFEEFRVGCYEASTGGYFKPHRDDILEGVSHRLFAITINLNVGEYEGGCLRFPEFGEDLYRAESGGAIVFSGRMLHEVTPVVSGRRFSLVTFLYGEKESQQRKAFYRRTMLE
jgi:hypothetical protein